ncbi:ABC transporter ATP-binding protein [Alkalihalophilus sp. As8PL]|uniref:ABC transporter ATP-binding protein n=2 Tax=Alkalihalophilus TaxID=2893060 RepID=A0AB39BR70_9BACI|nr:ABC transporter ATP-binding protein [Alkalihalophilus lindianensis]MDV2685218.1 ABC transporter ATP-binding protein [Alkalihalophilus lindianensis]
MKLTVDQLSTTIEQKSIIDQITMFVESGQFVGIIGPNGSGKSTLLKTIYRILRPNAGLVSLNNEDILKFSHKEFARSMAVVAQEGSAPFDFTVEEIVLMGRSPHKRFFERDTLEDAYFTRTALVKVGLEGYSDRSFSTLSGGEKQRVLIARALVQKASFLILDEPTNHLDIHHQLHILDIIRKLGVSTLAAIHDLNLAAAYCDVIYVINEGEIVKHGTPSEVVTRSMLKEIFKVDCTVTTHPITGKLQISYVSEGMYKGSTLSQTPDTTVG